jgi:hypothetical protein
VSLRGDRFHEHLATEPSTAQPPGQASGQPTATGRSSTPLFWNGVEWVSSLTATVDVRPHDNISFRAELRHDQADGSLYFTSAPLQGDGSARAPFVPNGRAQQTALLGATAWF